MHSRAEWITTQWSLWQSCCTKDRHNKKSPSKPDLPAGLNSSDLFYHIQDHNGELHAVTIDRDQNGLYLNKKSNPLTNLQCIITNVLVQDHCGRQEDGRDIPVLAMNRRDAARPKLAGTMVHFLPRWSATQAAGITPTKLMTAMPAKTNPARLLRFRRNSWQ